MAESHPSGVRIALRTAATVVGTKDVEIWLPYNESTTSIREELARGRPAVRRRHAAHLPHGLELYGEADAAELPLPDELHPDAAAHRLIAERFARTAFGAGGPFTA